MAQKNAFCDPATMVLKCWGFVESNDSGDIKVPVTEDFDLKPGDWKWDGVSWQPYSSPTQPNPVSTAKAVLKALDPKKATVADILPLLDIIEA